MNKTISAQNPWTTFGTPRALKGSLREAIRDGRLAAGTRLPSTRVLASDLGLARGTVVEAYAQLQAEGYLSSRHGSGTWVAKVSAPTRGATSRAAPSPPPRFSFHPGLPDLTAFPHAVWAAAVTAPAGWAAYVLAVGVRTGDPLGGYFAVQRRWGSRFDFGAGAMHSAAKVLTGGSAALTTTVTVAVLAAAALLAALLVLDRVPLPLLAYTGVLMLITYGGAGFFESKPRFLLPAFPLLMPVAAAMAKARPRTAVVVTAALAGLSYGYGAYLLLAAKAAL